MKYCPLVIKITCFVSFLFLSCSHTGRTITCSVTQCYLSERPLPREVIPPSAYLRAVDRGTRTVDGRPGDAYWQQFAEYEIEATLSPELRKIFATTRITYHNHSPDTLRQLHLELAQNHHAEGVTRNRPAEITGGINLREVMINGTELDDDRAQRSRYGVQGTRMIIRPPQLLPPGGSTELMITYDFDIPQRGAGGRMGYSGDNLFFLGYWYPHMVVYDDVVGWHPDPYLGQAEFYHGFADYRLTIRAPENWIVMATGELLNAYEVLNPNVYKRWKEARQSDKPMRVYTAGSDEPATRNNQRSYSNFHASSDFVDNACSWYNDEYGDSESSKQAADHITWSYSAENVRNVAFSATLESNWDSARTPVGDVNGDGHTNYTVINSFWREEAPLWSEVTTYQQHAIGFLSNITGFPYPWPHMTAVEGGGIIGGGMEYPMMTIMGDYNRRGAEALYSVTAHELAHMWIPMIVSTDERRYSWFDEGHTVFITAEAVRDRYPERRPHRQTQNAYIAAARRGDEGSVMRRSDYQETFQHFIIASYRKPSAVLQALRKLIGEDVFWEAYRSFIKDWAFKQTYPWDFFRTVERISERDLNWFWYSWYYETWTLNQAVDQVLETEKGTRIVIRDEGDVPMPVYLTVTFDDDRKAWYEIPVDSWLKGKRRAEIEIPEQQVRRVQIDANQDLPDINRKNTVWER